MRCGPIRSGWVKAQLGRAAASREPVQVPDILEERELRDAQCARCLNASVIVLPGCSLLREDRIMGGLTVRRNAGEFRPGSSRTFADLCDAVSLGDPERPAVP